MSSTSEVTAASRPVVGAILGGLSAGTLDMLYAVGRSALNGRGALGVLQSVGSGLIGSAAFEGGVATAVFGLICHFIITLAGATVFMLAYPLTVTDNHSRYVLACQGLRGTQLEPTKAVLTKVFKEYGLPLRLRSDNGVPFAAYSLGRLSRLSVWLLKLGITPELIEPGKPQQNGRHERMHRTLKDETLKPPAANATVQQRKFNSWRREFNEDRPHEAHDGLAPEDVHVASPRQMPSELLVPEYPDRFEVRYVSANGGIRWRKKWVNVSSVLIGEHVGLEEVDDGQWDVYFANYRLGRLNERFMRIEDALGKLKRRV